MDLIIKYTQYRQDGIFGNLTDDSGVQICVILTHAYGNNGQGFVPKLPPGIFKCVRGLHSLVHHPKPFETFEVTGVTGHAGILFHVGNFNNDSDGCILLGKEILISPMAMITDSQMSFDKFMIIQDGVNEFNLTVIS